MTGDYPDFSDISDQRLSEALASQFRANDLRSWMAENGLTRSRGANKMESARQAVEQDREGIARELFDAGVLEVDWDRRCRYHGACGNTTTGSHEVCDECIDMARANDRARDPVDRDDYDDPVEYMREVRSRHA